MLILSSTLEHTIQPFHEIAALIFFAVTILLIIIEKLPQAVTAMVGAFLFIVFQIITQEEAIAYIDFDTIGLLVGMMISVSVMRKSGIFEFIAIKGIKMTKGNPWRILITLSIVTAFLSAFLDNVTTVLIIVPLTFAVADVIDINPLPILISEVLFSNIGGAATLIGDPPNIMIGGATDLDFMAFLDNNLIPVVIVSIVSIVMLRLYYFKQLNQSSVEESVIQSFDEKRTITNKKYLAKALVLFFLIIGMFVTHHMHGISLASIALGGGFLLMAVTIENPEEMLKEVEWPTIFFFVGLFIMVGALEKVGIIEKVAHQLLLFTNGEVAFATQLVLWVSALSTSVINSIPFTATMISVIKNMAESMNGNVEPLWWALSLGACFGGNATLIGAAANIIVAGMTQKSPYPLRLVQYIKVAVPITLMSTIVASIYLYIRYFL